MTHGGRWWVYTVEIMEQALRLLLHKTEVELSRAKNALEFENARLPKKPRLKQRPGNSGIQLHMFPNGYQLVRGDSKQSSSLIPYTNKTILDEVSSGRIPLSITSWLESDKLCMRDGTLELAVVERSKSGSVLSTHPLQLRHASTALESSQILSETRQIYRWSLKDRLILDTCLSLTTSDPLCLEPNPIVHLIQNRASGDPFSADVPPIDRSSSHPGVKTNHDRKPKVLEISSSLPVIPIIKPVIKSSTVPHRREIRMKSQLGRCTQLVTIEVIRTCSGYSGKAVCQQLTSNAMSPSPVKHEFTAETPKEAELFAQQYVLLFSNNKPSHTSISVTEDETCLVHEESPQTFPFPLFPSLWENRFEPLPVEDKPPAIDHLNCPFDYSLDYLL